MAESSSLTVMGLERHDGQAWKIHNAYKGHDKASKEFQAGEAE